MQKIMMLVKIWCDHAEGFEPGLRAWELDVGEWERASGNALAGADKYTVMMNMAPNVLWNSLQPPANRQQHKPKPPTNRQQTASKPPATASKPPTHHQHTRVHTPTVPIFEQRCCNGVTLAETLERIRPCQLEMERAQMMTGRKSTLSRKARGTGKANTKSREEIARPARPTRALQTSTRARTETNLGIGRKTAGNQVEERTTIPPVTTATCRKARTTRKAKVKANTLTLWKRISLLPQLQPCCVLHKHTVQLESSCAIQTWNRVSWV